MPDSRQTAFGGVMRDEEGDVIDGKAAESDMSSLTRTDMLPVDYIVITELSELFERAVEDILWQNCVGVAMEGINLGRHGQLCWVQIATVERVFLFDILSIGGDKAFDAGLRAIMQSTRLQKVMHDCRAISDMLHHRFNTSIINIFDTQVADIIVHRVFNHGRLPSEVCSQTSCIMKHLNVSIEQTYSQTAYEQNKLSNAEVWAERPACQWIHHMAVVRVMYLLELRVRLLEKMLTDFIDGVDIFLSLLRDADPDTHSKLQHKHYYVPREFLQLSASAMESRQRTASLHSNLQVSEPLPVKISGSSRRLSDSVVEDHAAATHEVNGNIGSSAEQSHVVQACTASANHSDAVKLANGKYDPGLISDGSKTVNETSEEGDVHGSGDEHPQPPNLGGQPSRPTVGDIVLVAAGHEIAKLGQQKPHKNDQKTRYQYNAGSPVKQQNKADGHDVGSSSASPGFGQQSRHSTDAAVATPAVNQPSDANGQINQTASGSISDHHSGSLRPPSVSMGSAAHQAERSEQYNRASQPTSNVVGPQQSDCDIISAPADFSISSLTLNCVIPASPHFRHSASTIVGHENTTSPSPCESSVSDLSSDSTAAQNLPGHSTISQSNQGNGMGRGQISAGKEAAEYLSNDSTAAQNLPGHGTISQMPQDSGMGRGQKLRMLLNSRFH